MSIESSSSRKTFDWTRDPPPPNLTPFQKFTRDVDWKASPLGPMDSWPFQLRQLVLLVMADPEPAVVYWGETQAHVYNEAYAPLLGEIHPCQGQQPSVALAEIWAQFDKIIVHGQETGQTLVGGNQFLLLNRYGFHEETYFSWKSIPIIGEDGSVVANYVTITEVTRDVLGERRMKAIYKVGQELANASNLKEVWAHLLTGLEQNDKDVPLALLYSVKITATTACVLEGAIGLPAGHETAPGRMDLENGSEALAKVFRDCRTNDGTVLLRTEDGNLPVDLFHDVAWRGFGVPSNGVVKQYDNDYQSFIDMLTQEITTSHVSTMLLAEEIKQRQGAAQQAALERAQLSEQLLARTAEYQQSEVKFSRFADRVNVGFAIVDLEGRVLYANDVWRRMFSVRRGNWDPTPWMNAIVPEDQADTLSIWHEICVGKKAIRKPLRLRIPTDAGEEEAEKIQSRYMACRFDAYPDLDEDGNVASITACVVDISEIKRIEKQVENRTRELEQSELKYRQFAENAPVGVSLINQKGIIEFANEAWLSITGQAEIQRKSWLKSFHHGDVSMLRSLFVDLLASKKPFTVESRVQRPYKAEDFRTHSSERPAWILVSAHPEINDRGVVENVVCWLTDISDQKSAERDLRARMDEALEMKRQQENFIDMISHEIRNPLSAQLHCAEEIISLASDDPLKTELLPASSSLPNVHSFPGLKKLLGNVKEAARIISTCVHHQKRIVDDVLTLSKLDSDLLTISPTPVQAAKLAQDAFKMFKGELEAADITLKFKKDPSMRDLEVDWVNLDPGRIIQILINLAGNALKFTRDEAQREIIVSVSASLENPSTFNKEIEYFPRSKGRKDSQVSPVSAPILRERLYLTWTVEDTGRGISHEEKKVLFRRFSQASPKTHSKYGGSGLGLFISRQLTEMQGGKIGVASELGKGSKFVFFVKALRAYPDPILVGREVASNESLSEVTPRRHSIPKLRILVVEDNLVNQKVLVRQLRNHGYTVSVANHGGDALEVLQGAATTKNDRDEGAVDVVLMDLEMPVMNGLVAIGEIRKLEASGRLHGHIPVIACTASVRDVAAALDAGMDSYITKPFRIEDILLQIEKLHKQCRQSSAS